MSTVDKPLGSPDTVRRGMGVLAIACYLTHSGYWVFLRGEPENMLWSCHLSSFLIGVGLLARLNLPFAIGVLWLCVGTPLWLLDVFTGGEFLPTSMLTHLGGLAIGVFGVRYLGMEVPRFTWVRALFCLALLQQLCRWLTPMKTNVNVAFDVWEGWRSVFPTYYHFWFILGAVCGLVYFAAELGLRALSRVAARTECVPS